MPLVSLLALFLLLSSTSSFCDPVPDQGFTIPLRRLDSDTTTLVRNSYARAKSLGGTDVRQPLHATSGGFTVQVEVGTPPQRLELLFDTGSDLAWMRCGENSQSFHDRRSSTFRILPCDDSRCSDLPQSECRSCCSFVAEYGGGSQTRGRAATETFTLAPDRNSTRFSGIVFGCADRQQGFDNFSGLVGFGRGAVSWLRQLNRDHPSSIEGKFAYCLAGTSKRRSSLSFGRNAGFHHRDHQSTPILRSSDRSYYFVSLTGISVGGVALHISHNAFDQSGGTILDSGTTLTFLPASVYHSVRAAFRRDIDLPEVDGSVAGMDLCYNVSRHQSHVFPSLVLRFRNASMAPDQRNYFTTPEEWSGSVACLALASSDGLGINVVGNLMQQDYKFSFDTGKSVVSFARTECGGSQDE